MLVGVLARIGGGGAGRHPGSDQRPHDVGQELSDRGRADHRHAATWREKRRSTGRSSPHRRDEVPEAEPETGRRLDGSGCDPAVRSVAGGVESAAVRRDHRVGRDPARRDPALVHAVVQAESNYQPRARSTQGRARTDAGDAVDRPPAGCRQPVRPQEQPRRRRPLPQRHCWRSSTCRWRWRPITPAPRPSGTTAGCLPFPETRTYVERVLADLAQ